MTTKTEQDYIAEAIRSTAGATGLSEQEIKDKMNASPIAAASIKDLANAFRIADKKANKSRKKFGSDIDNQVLASIARGNTTSSAIAKDILLNEQIVQASMNRVNNN